jgi:hypothetical protein
MQRFFLLLMLLIALAGQAQNRNSMQTAAATPELYPIRSLGGTTYNVIKESFIAEGSLFYSESWMKLQVLAKNGSVYTAKKAKLNLVDRSMLFMDEKGELLVASTPFYEIALIDTVSRKTFRIVDASYYPAEFNVPQGCYEMLVEGKTDLIMSLHKRKVEERPLYQATAEVRIYDTNNFFLVRGGKLIPFKLRDAADLFPDRRKEVKAFLDDAAIRLLPPAQRLKALVEYYNAL